MITATWKLTTVWIFPGQMWLQDWDIVIKGHNSNNDSSPCSRISSIFCLCLWVLTLSYHSFSACGSNPCWNLWVLLQYQQLLLLNNFKSCLYCNSDNVPVCLSNLTPVIFQAWYCVNLFCSNSNSLLHNPKAPKHYINKYRLLWHSFLKTGPSKWNVGSVF